MTMAEVEVKRWGNSLGILLPKDLVRLDELNEGEKIKIDVIKTKKIDGFGILKGKHGFKRDHDDHGEFF